MKISRDQLMENRRKILDAAARLFREHGFEAVTVSAVMKAAGLTHGAFYNHFDSKDDLITKTFAHVLLPEPENVRFADMGLGDFGRYYLSPEHRDDLAGGCILSALGSEGSRCNHATRDVMTEAVRKQLDRFAATAPGETPEERRRTAISQWSAMIGAVILARAVDDPALSDELLCATREAMESRG